ncbi:MAG: MFS transporter [bacterium]
MSAKSRRLRTLLTRLPVISTLMELDAGPRAFIYFITFNLISWQCVVGPTLVLFARKIEMPESRVGLLMAFVPISMILVILTGLIVIRFGPKRVILVSWFLRNLMVCSVFLMPWAIVEFGTGAAGFVLMISTLGFCLMRAVGAGGWMPWLHEIVPEKQRSSYFSAEAAISNLLAVGLTAAQGLILHGNPGIWRFLAVYGIGVVAGFVSLLLLRRVPGGKPSPATPGDSESAFKPHLSALRDRPYVTFIVFAGFCFASMSWFNSAVVLYMRDALQVSPGLILYLTAFGSAAIMLTIGFWGRYADHAGGPHALALSLSSAALMSFGCMLVLPGMKGMIYALAAVLITFAVFNSAFWATINRTMLDYLNPAERVGYSNLWTVFCAIGASATPIIAGFIIDHFGMLGYRTCFLIGAVSSFACAIASLYVIKRERDFEFPWKQCPFYELPFRFIFSVAQISVGLHHSNRPGSSRKRDE